MRNTEQSTLSSVRDSPPDRTNPPRRKRDGGGIGASPPPTGQGQSPPAEPVEDPAEVPDVPEQNSRDPGFHRLPEQLSFASRGDEEEFFLQEIDRLRGDLASRSSGTAARPPGDELPAWDESPVEHGSPHEEWGAPSPYLEERLAIAGSLASELSSRALTVERNLKGLRTALETIEQELGHASEELGFVRSQGLLEESRAEDARTAAISHPSGLPSRTPAATGSYEDFTVARYNETVGDLHARRRAVGWGAIVLAIAISAILLYLTLRAHEAVPPIWLAVLPLVWMVPVPFFVAAFRGTHRVLRENRLELPEET